MMKYTYKGMTKAGESVEETVEVPDRFAVYDIARERGVEVTRIVEAGGFGLARLVNVEKINAAISRVSADQLVLTTRNLGAMLKAGLPLSRALSVIERQSSNPKLRLIIADLRERVAAGEPFHDALAAHPRVFNDLYIAMVRAGEESGGLSETLKILAVQMERSSNLKKKIKGAMIYPAIVITVLLIIGVLMMFFVMPSITGTFKSLAVALPLSTRILIGVSDFLVANMALSAGLFLAAIVGLVVFYRTFAGKLFFQGVLLRLPVIGTMAKEVNSARTARTLASLLLAGVDVVRALDITRDVVQNVYYKPVIAAARQAVEGGQPLSGVFLAHSKLYPVFVGEMMMVGEETGQVGNMLKELATFYEEEVERKTKDLSTIIEPILMVVIGGTVGFFALAMITPIYSISDSI